MYLVLKSLKFIYIIQLYIFRTQLCPSSGASQLRMQSLVPINYKNTCCLQICHYVHFIITTNYLFKIFKIYLHYSALHVSDTVVSIIRSISAAHAVSGPYQL